ncbi:MAG: hypothetical protein JSW28_02465 [Thermoplasmata archaeon]|nr:MAG: hypothetical protein JSW28_02465 [Thermoplasmata archaeon]
MERKTKDDVVPFRVALMLKRYKFGSNVAAKYLGKPRGLVQSWMQSGESHTLATKQFRLEAFEKKLKTVRRAATKENIYFFLAGKLLEMDLPAEYIGKHLGVPPSTIRAWKGGVSPKSVKKLFVDRRYLDREFARLLDYMRYESTRQNLPYYLSLRIVEEARNKVGPRRIGGKTISHILYKHLNIPRPIPKETITCWVEGRRRPKNAFAQLKNKELIEDEFKRIVDELTDEFMDYHLAKELFHGCGWNYSRISKTLGIDKERVRGWVKKDRGNPVAKTFKNELRVKEDLKRFIEESSQEEITDEEPAEWPKFQENIENTYDPDLEDEILYHLSFFPNGITSAQAIKSILIDNKDATTDEIKNVLENSPRIVKKTGRWLLGT